MVSLLALYGDAPPSLACRRCLQFHISLQPCTCTSTHACACNLAHPSTQLYALTYTTGNVKAVRELLEHPAFSITNPNSCYSTFLTFARSPKNFHAADGSGYEFLADMVLRVDKINPTVASRMVSAFNSWKQYDEGRQAAMKAQLQRVVGTEGLSENVFEIASKAAEF